eukprot:5960107-Prymnesium_polylepis.2
MGYRGRSPYAAFMTASAPSEHLGVRGRCRGDQPAPWAACRCAHRPPQHSCVSPPVYPAHGRLIASTNRG